jgi:hypothetical protein
MLHHFSCVLLANNSQNNSVQELNHYGQRYQQSESDGRVSRPHLPELVGKSVPQCHLVDSHVGPRDIFEVIQLIVEIQIC